MYIHIIAPDPKFPNLIHRLFTTHAGHVTHKFIIISAEPNNNFLGDHFSYVKNAKEIKNIVNFEQCDGILLHGILTKAAPFLNDIPNKIKVAWFIWGYEIYRAAYPKNNGLLDPLTAAYAFPKQKAQSTTLREILNRISNRGRKEARRKKEARTIIRKIDYVVTQLKEEFSMLEKMGYLTDTNDWIDAPVLELSDLVGQSNSSSPISGEDIQVGNSATVTNNHIDVFKKLASFELEERKVIVPLSYGKDDYRDYVLEKGREILGEHFYPITDFKPLDEYLSLFKHCSISIFNHHRQQAVGNIIAALWQGRTVYLGQSPILDDFKRRGLPAHSFKTDFTLDRPQLSDLEIQSCHTKLLQSVGHDAVANKINQLLEKLKA